MCDVSKVRVIIVNKSFDTSLWVKTHSNTVSKKKPHTFPTHRSDCFFNIDIFSSYIRHLFEIDSTVMVYVKSIMYPENALDYVLFCVTRTDPHHDGLQFACVHDCVCVHVCSWSL